MHADNLNSPARLWATDARARLLHYCEINAAAVSAMSTADVYISTEFATVRA